MDFEALKNLRDARGLSADEKAFLFVAISRGEELFGTWDTNAADMGMGKNRYYRTRDALLAKRLLEVVRKYNGSSVYRVNLDLLADWHSHSGNGEGQDSHSGNEHSHSGNDDSHYGETKKNKKKNIKKNLQEEVEPTTVASAPVVDSDSPLQRGRARYSYIYRTSSKSSLKNTVPPGYFINLDGETRTAAPVEEKKHRWTREAEQRAQQREQVLAELYGDNAKGEW